MSELVKGFPNEQAIHLIAIGYAAATCSNKVNLEEFVEAYHEALGNVEFSMRTKEFQDFLTFQNSRHR